MCGLSDLAGIAGITPPHRLPIATGARRLLAADLFAGARMHNGAPG